MGAKSQHIQLPTSQQIRQAIELYLVEAYGRRPPAAAAKLMPSKRLDVECYLMSDSVERTPADAKLPDVRSFVLRLGNAQYPHMKLRLSRPPHHGAYVFSIDSHDAFLHVPANSPERPALEKLKRHNAAIAAAVCHAWEAAGLPTEKGFLRRQLREAKKAK